MSTAYAAGPSLSLGSNDLRLWSASAVSNLADGIFVVALPLVAVFADHLSGAGGRRVDRGSSAVAGVARRRTTRMADRLDRRVTRRNVQIMRVVMVALALAGGPSRPVPYVTAFVLGIGETLFDTAAQSIMPNIVPKALLARANSRLYAVELTMNAFIGPPLGGFLAAVPPLSPRCRSGTRGIGRR